MGAHHAAQRAVGAAVLVGALWSAYCAPPAPVVASGDAVPEESFAISAVTIFDGKTFGPDQYVWVDDGSIRAVGQALDLPDGLVVRHVIIFGYGHGLQRAIIDESQHRTPERLVMAQH